MLRALRLPAVRVPLLCFGAALLSAAVLALAASADPPRAVAASLPATGLAVPAARPAAKRRASRRKPSPSECAAAARTSKARKACALKKRKASATKPSVAAKPVVSPSAVPSIALVPAPAIAGPPPAEALAVAGTASAPFAESPGGSGTPPVELKAPIEPISPVEEPKLPVEEPKPPVEEPKPPVEESKPPVEESKPPVEGPIPPVEEPKPLPPVEELTQPIEELIPPVEESKSSAEEKANEERAKEEKAREVEVEEERAAEAKAQEERAREAKVAEERAKEAKAAEERLAEEKALEVKAKEVKAAEGRAKEVKAQEVKAQEEKVVEERAKALKAEEEKAEEERAAEEKAAEEKAAEEKVAKEEKASKEKAAEEKAAKEKAREEKAWEEKAAEEKRAAEEKAKEESEAPFRFFSPTSFWNEELPANAPLDPSSAAIVGAFDQEIAKEDAAKEGQATINTTAWSVPVYTVPADQPTVKVTLENATGGRAALQSAWDAVPLPANAQPAAGSDKHLVVWQPSTDKLWEFWHMELTSAGWQAGWGGAMENASSDSGAYGPEDWAGATSNWGASATSLPLAGGLITLEDLEKGQINHALAMALPDTRAGAYSSPAERDDGWDSEPLSLPEGAHLRLEPGLNLAALHLPKMTLMMAEAAQRYGIVVRDSAANVAFYGQDPTPTGTNPYTGAHGYYEGKSAKQILEAFPWSHLQLLKMELHSTS